jgi:hypothetical protein
MGCLARNGRAEPGPRDAEGEIGRNVVLGSGEATARSLARRSPSPDGASTSRCPAVDTRGPRPRLTRDRGQEPPTLLWSPPHTRGCSGDPDPRHQVRGRLPSRTCQMVPPALNCRSGQAQGMRLVSMTIGRTPVFGQLRLPHLLSSTRKAKGDRLTLFPIPPAACPQVLPQVGHAQRSSSVKGCRGLRHRGVICAARLRQSRWRQRETGWRHDCGARDGPAEGPRDAGPRESLRTS